MKFVTTIARSLQADMQAELRDIERAVTTGTGEAGRGLKTELHRQVTSAGLGTSGSRTPGGTSTTRTRSSTPRA